MVEVLSERPRQHTRSAIPETILPAALYLAAEINEYREQTRDSSTARKRESHERKFLISLEAIGESFDEEDIAAARKIQAQEINWCRDLAAHLSALLEELFKGKTARSIVHFEQQLEALQASAQMTTEFFRKMGFESSPRRLARNAAREKLLSDIITALKQHAQRNAA